MREKKSSWSRNLRPRDEETDEDYANPDGDERGDWISHALQSRNYYSKGTYSIKCPGGRLIEGPPDGTYWRVEEDKLWKLDADKRVWWGATGNNAPRIKEFLDEAKDGVVPVSWWNYKYAGTNSGAKTQLRDMMGGEGFFDTPKPIELIERILDLATDSESIILDAFAGSGTTGHAVLRRNAADGGKRRFILVETIAEISENVTARRLMRAVEGYESTRKDDFIIKEASITTRSIRNGPKLFAEFDQLTLERQAEFDRIRVEIQDDRIALIGEKTKSTRIAGLNSGFRFCTLGEPLFDADGNVSPAVTFPDLAAHVFFCETGSPIPHRATGETPLIGTFQGRAIYLLHNADAVGVASTTAGNVLTGGVLDKLPLPEPGFLGARIVYGEGCTVPEERLSRLDVTFKQIPYQIEGL